MTREDQVLGLLADANPVSDPNAFVVETQIGPRLETIEQWSGTMTENELRSIEPPTTGKSRRGWLVAAVAAVAVLIVGIGAAVAFNNQDTVPVVAPTTTTAAPTTTATTSAAASSDPVARYDGKDCTYEGPTEFDSGSTVTFTFVNETDIADVGFAVWYVPDGTTAAEIEEKGIFEVVGDPTPPPYEYYWIRGPPTTKDREYQAWLTLEPAGQHLINCWDPDGDHPTMFTVKDN